MKTCRLCNCKKELTDFGQRKSSKDNLQSWCRNCINEKAQLHRIANPEAVRAAKQRYYASDKGKTAKRREDAAYVLSGGRAEAEQRRAQKPVSEARKAARKKWSLANQIYWTASRAKRRSLEKALSEDDFWVLQEAVALAKLRGQMLGSVWHVDHVIPVSKGGAAQPNNLQVVPASWNRQKSNKHSEWFFPRA